MFKLITAVFVMMAAMAHAEQSISEGAAAKSNDVKRAVKKGAHRVKEMVCAKGDAACLAEKAKHRVQEGSDYVEDKAKEGKNKVD